MGKTSIVLNLAKNVAQLHDLPVCGVQLEMSKEQLTYRLLSMEVGIEAGRLRTGDCNKRNGPSSAKASTPSDNCRSTSTTNPTPVYWRCGRSAGG
jgi:replicative DNA helicase